MPVNCPSLVRQLSLETWHKTSGCARPNDHPKDIAVGDIVGTVSDEMWHKTSGCARPNDHPKDIAVGDIVGTVVPFVASAIIATISGTCIHLSVFVYRSIRSVSGNY